MDDLSRFYEADIKKALVKHIKKIEHLKPTELPVGFILAGQPGSGKSKLQEFARLSVPELVEVNGDNYRIDHPQYDDIMKWEPDHMPELTQDFANAVCERLMRYLLINKISFSVEGTGRNPEVPIRTAKELRAHGFRVHLLVMACRPEISSRSCATRYWEMVAAGQSPRPVNAAFHDEAVRSLPLSLKTIFIEQCQSRPFDEYQIVDRDGEIYWDIWKSRMTPDRALDNFFMRQLTEKETTSVAMLDATIQNLARAHDPYQR